MVKHLKLNPNGVIDEKTKKFDETKNVIEAVGQMRVFDQDHPLPEHALKPGVKVQL